ncbi:MAG: hypothetical protein GQ569_06230 [Methylococcaceae bacterium]|nr:hypothetical protein [Methylococcaceae bacterium]
MKTNDVRDFCEADLKETQFYKDCFLDGEVYLLLCLCKSRYGKLDGLIVKEIEKLSSTKVHELAKLLFNIDNNFTLDDLTNWLFPVRRHSINSSSSDLNYKEVFEIKGMLKILFMFCEKHYGKLDSSTINKIETLSIEKLDELIDLLINNNQDSFTLNSLKGWLQSS